MGRFCLGCAVAGQSGQHPDNQDLSGDTLPGQTRTPPYKGVQLSGVRTLGGFPMTAEQVVRQLRIIRHSPQAPRIGRRVPGIRTVAREAGLSFRTVYTIVQTGRITAAQALALARALEAVQNDPN